VKPQLTPLRLEFELSELIQPLLFPLLSLDPKKGKERVLGLLASAQ